MQGCNSWTTTVLEGTAGKKPSELMIYHIYYRHSDANNPVRRSNRSSAETYRRTLGTLLIGPKAENCPILFRPFNDNTKGVVILPDNVGDCSNIPLQLSARNWMCVYRTCCLGLCIVRVQLGRQYPLCQLTLCRYPSLV